MSNTPIKETQAAKKPASALNNSGKENQTTGKEVRVKVFIWPIMDKPGYIYYDTHGEAIEHLAKEATRLSKEQLRLLGKLSYIEKLAARR